MGDRVRSYDLYEIQPSKRVLKDYLKENPAMILSKNCSNRKYNPSHDKERRCSDDSGSIFKIQTQISSLILSLHL